jgi:hypothetical protein
MALGVDSAVNRNEYQKYFLGGGGKGSRCTGLTTLPPSCADCLEIWEPQPPGTLRACNGIAFFILFVMDLKHASCGIYEVCQFILFGN